MVGGRDFFGAGSAAKLNLAVQGRQAGSSFKPLVLAAALAEGIPASKTYAAPGCITLPATTTTASPSATTPTGRRSRRPTSSRARSTASTPCSCS